MICPNCKNDIQEGASFCPECGISLKSKNKKPRKPTAQKMMKDGQHITENIILCQDGKYRWIYELNLLKNPTIFVLIWKIFFFIFLGIFIMINIFDIANWGFNSDNFLNNLKFCAYFLIGMTVVTGLGYLLYAAIMGGKYCVMFEMDEKGINHKQMPHQVKKAQAIAALTGFAGLASGNMTIAGVGMNSARTEMYTDFDSVRKALSYPRRNLIKLNELIEHNQVYAESVDFEFVKNYIFSRCNNAKVKK